MGKWLETGKQGQGHAEVGLASQPPRGPMPGRDGTEMENPDFEVAVDGQTRHQEQFGGDEVVAGSKEDEEFVIRVVTPDGSFTKDEVIQSSLEGVRSRNTARRQRLGSRLISFFDAVVAIAITILALEIAVPAVEAFTFADAQTLFVPFTSLFISYLALGQLWAEHARTFAQAEYEAGNYDVFGHLILLFFIILFPKTTSLMAAYPNSLSAAAIYLICFIAMVTIEGVMVISLRSKQFDQLKYSSDAQHMPLFDRPMLAALLQRVEQVEGDDFTNLLYSFLAILRTEAVALLTSTVMTFLAVVFLFIAPWACYACFFVDIVIILLCYRSMNANMRTLGRCSESCGLSLGV